MAGRITIAEVEHLVDLGEIPPEDVHTPGVFVQRVVEVGPDSEKRIERRTTRPRTAAGAAAPAAAPAAAGSEQGPATAGDEKTEARA